MDVKIGWPNAMYCAKKLMATCAHMAQNLLVDHKDKKDPSNMLGNYGWLDMGHIWWSHRRESHRRGGLFSLVQVSFTIFYSSFSLSTTWLVDTRLPVIDRMHVLEWWYIFSLQEIHIFSPNTAHPQSSYLSSLFERFISTGLRSPGLTEENSIRWCSLSTEATLDAHM